MFPEKGIAKGSSLPEMGKKGAILAASSKSQIQAAPAEANLNQVRVFVQRGERLKLKHREERESHWSTGCTGELQASVMVAERFCGE